MRNRERLVSAAREMFVEFGPQVPYDEIARRAGLGNATLYRNFPERADLVHEVVLSITERMTALAERSAAEEADTFAAIRRFTHGAVEERVGALCPILDGAFDKKHPDLIAGRERFEQAVQTLFDRAHGAGRLRADVGVGDLMVVLSQLTRPLPGASCGAGFDRFVHRHLQLLLDGLETPARSELPGSAATLEDLRRESCTS
ncbi:MULTISPECIES: TetR/AcrR family transcriptional regulator [unclassified Streptomyces]|uniref:TetR/AcrR family transcriptional regulator n=1 Tax=unclassified Streptomyces TaxID=2593676 RepID=UPI001CB6F49D|nr:MULTISPECIES: TetR/AcrR family transcriptional regulator [unclassified Streptomyces]MBD0709404.1 TetR family transcriptional regulator [Streptomyces sp. CBMA291]MBD0713833.1 TetR family transcriptional regulator [Streptomyces sp. CBMA370]